jgi:excisionase family DNA binding protein
MRNTDPRVRELFSHVRQAVNILEDLLLRSLPTAEQPQRVETKSTPRDLPAPAMPQKLAYSIKEVHESVGASRSMVYREIGEGKLRAVKRGNRTLILAADLQDWISRWPAARSERN